MQWRQVYSTVLVYGTIKAVFLFCSIQMYYIQVHSVQFYSIQFYSTVPTIYRFVISCNLQWTEFHCTVLVHIAVRLSMPHFFLCPFSITLLFYSDWFYSTLNPIFYSLLFYCLPFYCMSYAPWYSACVLSNYPVLSWSVLLNSTLFHSIHFCSNICFSLLLRLLYFIYCTP